jgi:hypothetical protein
MKRMKTGRAAGGSVEVGARSRHPLRMGLLAVLAALSLVAAVAVAQAGDAAWAKDYPSWNDVMAARNNEAAKKNEISRLQALIKQNEDAVASTQATSLRKGEEFIQAQQAHDAASRKAAELQSQADAAHENATES